jgi:hypothetical protein
VTSKQLVLVIIVIAVAAICVATLYYAKQFIKRYASAAIAVTSLKSIAEK